MVAFASVKTDFSHGKKAVEKLNDGLSTASLTASLTVVHGMLKSNTEKMFNTQKDAWGRDWEPLTENTKAIRRSLGFEEGPINQRTGKLRAYMTPDSPSITGHSDAVVSLVYPGRQIPDQSIVRRLNQSEGIKNGATARSVFGPSEKDIAKILVFMNNSIFRGLGR